jgi:hypothetical protein
MGYLHGGFAAQRGDWLICHTVTQNNNPFHCF